MKDRAITGFGPFILTLTGSTSTTDVAGWVRCGPLLANRLNARATFSTNSTAAKRVTVEGVLYGGRSTGLSTATAAITGGTILCSRTSTETAGIASTVALLVSHLRLRSTGLPNNVVATVHLAAIA